MHVRYYHRDHVLFSLNEWVRTRHTFSTLHLIIHLYFSSLFFDVSFLYFVYAWQRKSGNAANKHGAEGD